MRVPPARSVGLIVRRLIGCAEAEFRPHDVPRWATTTTYHGDRSDVVPPSGGTVTSTITDIRDHTVALRQYHGTSATGAYDETTYRYNRKDQLDLVTDPGPGAWPVLAFDWHAPSQHPGEAARHAARDRVAVGHGAAVCAHGRGLA